MGLPEILMLINLVAICIVAVLLLILIRRVSQKDNHPADNTSATQAVLDGVRRMQQEMMSTLRTEWQSELRGTRTEILSSVQSNVERLGQTLRESQQDAFGAQDRRLDALIKTQETRLSQLIEAQNRLFAMQDKQIAHMQQHLTTLLTEKMTGISDSVSQRLEELNRQFQALREQNRTEQEALRRTMEASLNAMQTQNARQLEKMRETVDEKLQHTLNERISQSFQLVNERLADVYRGLGEMQTLAANVGDLKKVMSGVKTRGILGEIQLGAIIQELLSPEQYETNVATKKNSANRVEYAIRLPGERLPGERLPGERLADTTDSTVYLPIDAKFPADAYQHLLDAYETADPEKIKTATTELERRIKAFAKDIHDKYIDPPYTTNFGIMFLPFEGLYAEVVRLGLVEELQRLYQVSVAGPTTLSALLNSLQMGFRTLAIQKRSGEVWEVLGAVKTEFGTFGKVLAKAQERIEQTSRELDTLVGVRTRKINSKLRAISELPVSDAQALLDTAEDD